MATKSHSFDDLSGVQCGCGKAIKSRIIASKPSASMCYQCFQEYKRSRGKKHRVFKEAGAVYPMPTSHYKNPPRK